MPEPNQCSGLSLVKLAQQSGPIGYILRSLHPWMLSAADKWAEQGLDYESKRNIPNRLSLPDPWQFLLDAPSVPPSVKSVCRAAQSQLWAWRRIGRMAMGLATLNDDPHERAMKLKACGDQEQYARTIAKFAAHAVAYGPIQRHFRSTAKDPKIIRQMAQVLKHRRQQLAHRGKAADMGRSWPSYEKFALSNKLPATLVYLWVYVPASLVLCPPERGLQLQPGTPGLMFFRNEALTKFLQFALHQKNLTPATVKKVRQQLKLIPVGDHQHFIWDVCLRRADGHLEIQFETRFKKNSPLDIRRPKRVSRQIVAAIDRCGFTKIAPGSWTKTTSRAKWTIKTLPDSLDDDFFWIVVQKQ
jgi:hypothetical protein